MPLPFDTFGTGANHRTCGKSQCLSFKQRLSLRDLGAGANHRTCGKSQGLRFTRHLFPSRLLGLELATALAVSHCAGSLHRAFSLRDLEGWNWPQDLRQGTALALHAAPFPFETFRAGADHSACGKSLSLRRARHLSPSRLLGLELTTGLAVSHRACGSHGTFVLRDLGVGANHRACSKSLSLRRARCLSLRDFWGWS